jgi:hypothetical protein
MAPNFSAGIWMEKFGFAAESSKGRQVQKSFFLKIAMNSGEREREVLKKNRSRNFYT